MPVLLIVGLGRGETKRHMVQAFLDSGYELVVLTGSVPGWIGPLVRCRDKYAMRRQCSRAHGPGRATGA